MKFKATLTALALVLAAGSAQAQSSTQQSTNATAAIVNNTPGGGTDLSEQVPPVYAPGLDVGTSDCMQSFSGGGSGSGFGITFGASVDSTQCVIREWYKLMMRSQQPEIAWNIACQEDIVRQAALNTPGMTCPDQMTTKEVRQAKAERGGGDVPGYCADGGFASESVIRNNCPNAEQLLDR